MAFAIFLVPLMTPFSTCFCRNCGAQTFWVLGPADLQGRARAVVTTTSGRFGTEDWATVLCMGAAQHEPGTELLRGGGTQQCAGGLVYTHGVLSMLSV